MRPFAFELASRFLPLLQCSLLFASPDGPGVPKRRYPPSQIFQVIATIDAASGAPRAHGNASMHKGYLVVIFSEDGEPANGGFAFYDLADPYNPKLAFRKEDVETHEIREAHGYGYSSSYGADLVVLQAAYGIQIWDWTEVTNPVRLSYLRLPGIEDSNYALGAWWVFWQAPYIYIGGSGNGIYIVEASDPKNPLLVDRGAGRPNPIPVSQTGGFRVGPIFAVGNVLVASSMEEAGYTTFDISDPKNPTLLETQTQNMPPVYSILVNGDRILGVDTYNNFTVFDIGDPSRFRYVNGVSLGGRGGYVTFQDGFAHAGASSHFAKIDMRNNANYEVVGTASSGIQDRDEDFAVALGNLVVISDDHGNGSTIVPHQVEPDTLGPGVNMVVPHDGAVRQALTSRIGLTFTDAIDLRSLNSSTFIVRPYGSAPLTGKYSTQTGVVNFVPDAPLQPQTVYEIVIPQGGVLDLSGNAAPQPFTSLFSTGAAIALPLTCTIKPRPPARVDEEVLFEAESSGGTGAIQYSWNFGDGSATTPFSPASSLKHIYTRPGHFTVRVTATDAQSSTSHVISQTVHFPLTTLLPSSASNIISDARQSLVWNVNPDNATVTALDAATLLKRFEKSVGGTPRTLAQAPDGTIWVVNEKDATISVLAGVTGDLIQTISLPHASRPFSIVFSPDQPASNGEFKNQSTPIPEEAGGIKPSKYVVDSRRLVREGHDNLEPIAILPVYGYVTVQATGKLLQLDPSTRNVIAALEIGPTPRGLAISADAKRIFVSRFISPLDHGEVVEVDAESFTIVRKFNLALDPGPDTEAGGRGVPNYLHAITISPDGRRAWVPAKKDNTQRGGQRDGLRLTFESTVRTILAELDLVGNEEDLPARIDLNDRDLAVAVRFSPLGDHAFVATQGTNKIDVFDAYSLDLVTSIENVGRAPTGLVLDTAGTKLFVNSFLSRSVLVYDVSGIIQGTNNHAQFLGEISAVAQEKLPPLVLEGKRIFHNANDRRMNRDGYLSCASCHLDGEEDGRVWDFSDRGEGLRNTIALAGRRGTGHGRVHWSANFDEIQDFEHDIRGAFDGTGFMSDGNFNSGTHAQPLGDPKAGLSSELDALAAYLESLTGVPDSPYRNADGSLTAGAQAGRNLFKQLNCAVCHGGKDFTDSPSGLMHDVGTLQLSSGQRLHQPLLGLDTPTLRGLWATPPYLHDGSAATIMEVLTTANPNDIHGKTSNLTAQQRRQLADYLMQIDEREPAAPEHAPALVITSPRPQQVFTENSSIELRVARAAYGDSILVVEFFVDANKIGAVASAPFTLSWTANRPGPHVLTARALFAGGAKTLSAPVPVKIVPATEAVDDRSGATVPGHFQLSSGYPNPFNAEMRMQVDLPREGRVTAIIYGVDGRKVRLLCDENFPAGSHILRWNGKNSDQALAGTGIYILQARFKASSGKTEVAAQRLLLLK
jgi:DNA-binding beta-propeller fold protein YncE